jgi:galactokinase
LYSEAQLMQKLFDFETKFGRGGEIDLYFAPGRVNLIGEHTDYNGGKVLPMALAQGNYLYIRVSELPPARLYSVNKESEARFHPGEVKKMNDWADYVRGVFLYSQDACGKRLPPFDGLYFGDLPLEAGLSSSAALEMATALGMGSIGCEFDLSQAVAVSRRAENEFVDVFCGVMDQFSIAFCRKGHVMLLDCDTLEYQQVPFNLKDVSVVISHSGIYRSLAETPYNERKHECEQALKAINRRLGENRPDLSHIPPIEYERVKYALPEKLAARAEHVIYENVRVEEAARALRMGDAERLGHLMNRSHQSLRGLFEVSMPEIDRLQEMSVEMRGVHGARLTGAGFGGCVISLVDNDAVESFIRKMGEKYWSETHYEAEFIATGPEDGAHRVTP